jgi:multiple sugar transport system substrate-binding protein
MKNFSRLMVFVMIATLLFGCAPQATATQAPAPTQPPAPTAVPPTVAPPTAVPPTAVPVATKPAPTATPEPKPVTIRYANWNLGTPAEHNLQRQIIEAYTDLHPNVTIRFVDMSAAGGWDAVLTSYAAKSELPDVFMANNLPLYVQNGWVADLSAIVKNDAEWKNIPQALKDAFTYSGKTMAVPAGQFLMGYFVNTDLFDAANLNAPEYGVKVDDFFKVAQALNNVPKGILGLDEQEFIMGWYANTQDSKLKFNSFDGTKMNYNSAGFKAAVAKAAESKPLTWQGLSAEQQKNFKSKGPWELFFNQETGLRWDATWALADITKNAKFNWDFVGVPGGNQAIVFDAMVVSKTAVDVQAAYDFAKWMTFSSQSYAKRAALAKASNTLPDMPVSLDPASLALYKTFINKPGLNKALDNLNNSMLESLAKVVPGYIKARWEGKPGVDIGADKDVNVWFILNAAISGKIKYEDYSAKLEEFVNKLMADAQAAVNK